MTECGHVQPLGNGGFVEIPAQQNLDSDKSYVATRMAVAQPEMAIMCLARSYSSSDVKISGDASSPLKKSRLSADTVTGGRLAQQPGQFAGVGIVGTRGNGGGHERQE